jgi:hypothetical protein
MGSADSTFTDTRKVVLSPTSPLPLLYVTTLRKITIHLMPGPINPRFLQIFLVARPAIEEGETLPPKPVPHTQAALDRTDTATGLLADNTWATNGLPSHYTARPLRHYHITERHKIIFAYVTLNAHGPSLIGGSAKLVTPVDRSSCLSQAIDKSMRLQASARLRANTHPTDNSPLIKASEEDDTNDLSTETHPGDKNMEEQLTDDTKTLDDSLASDDYV